MVKKKENERMSATELIELAHQYRELALKAKDIEAQQKPIKEAIIAECKAQGVQGTLDLEALLVVSQTRSTQKLDVNFVTPDWLYRFQQKGGAFSIKLDDTQYVPQDILDEVHFSTSESQGYTLKLKA